MDAVVVRDNHQSFTQTFQGSCLRHVQSSPRPVPVPVPGTDAYPRTRGRVEGEPYDSVQDALLLSLPSSRSTSISEYSMPLDSVASLSSFHPASFGITKLDTVVSRSTPPPPAYVPPPRRSPTSLSRSSSQKLTSRSVHQHSLPPVSKSHETLRPTSLPTSLPSFRQHLDSFRPQQATIPGSAPPSPPPRPPAASTPEDFGASATKSPVHGSGPHKRFIELTPPPKISALAEDGSPSRVRRPSNFNRTAHLDARFDSDSPSDSDTESWSESSLGPGSELDHIEPSGTRQFPPLPPSAPLVTPGVIRRKASMTNRITTWISQYERSQTPRRWSGTDTRVNPVPEANDTSKGNAPKASAPPEDAVEQLWTKLKDQRAKLNDIKSQMSKKRKRLKELRSARDQADNAFMGIIRPVLVNPNGSLQSLRGNVDRRLAEMQRLRNEYQDLERDYEDQEMTLDEEEEELNKLETNFFSLLAVGNAISIRPPNEPEPKHFEDDNKDTPDLLRGISPNGPADEPHPLFQELMSAVGDLQNAKEDLDELLFLKADHENELKMKTAANMELTTAEKEFLADFPADQERMSDSVSKLQDKVTQLRQLCEEKGVMQKHLSSKVAYLLYPKQGYEDIELDPDDGSQPSLAHAKFSLLLSQPEHLLQEMPSTAGGALKAAAKLPDSDPTKRGRMQLASKEYSIDRLIIAHNEGGKTDFVNRWLLHQLRLSPLKALLLYVTFTTSQGLKIRDLLRWQRDVLHYWWVAERRDFNRAASETSDYESKFRTSQQSRRTSDVGSGVGSRLEW
ncbi:hypothetical protein CEP54_008415 [Fusarium duplospermum]|uniref:Uncharacterized protein n=1 Tax=Fusarium duplospermum TaxID=1325734 RepID=A0A428PVW0_9HYPO|nr:hypothetical protein CEP54_008415 [Fusarium duplospermum]